MERFCWSALGKHILPGDRESQTTFGFGAYFLKSIAKAGIEHIAKGVQQKAQRSVMEVTPFEPEDSQRAATLFEADHLH